MNPYRLSTGQRARNSSILTAVRRLAPVMADQRPSIIAAFVGTVVAAGASLLAPYLIGRAVDTYIRTGDYGGVLRSAALLLVAYVSGTAGTYVQAQQMGIVGRRVLFKLRNAIFTKLQELPLDFFNQNKAGDLISRINNDTDKLNVFFAQALVQLAANLFLMAGAAVFLVSLNVRLGLAALVPAAVVFVITRATGSLVKARNEASLQSLGGLSGEIQESMSNFRVIVAFNRVDYFQEQFKAANDRNYNASVRAGVLNTVFVPLYGLAFNAAQLIVVAYGFYLIAAGQFTVGLLIGFLLYVNSFYLPLRQLAAVWSSYQLAMASFDRISDVLALESNLPQLAAEPAAGRSAVMAFDHVGFGYVEGQPVLRDATFSLEPGKTYALVGPTGGGKTTTASLMARLYDPLSGRVLLDGRDIRTFAPAERAKRIGFILQEPILFTGTIRDNIVYGNDAIQKMSDAQLSEFLASKHLDGLIARFEQGLATKITAVGEGVSLGQKQLIAFIRAVLREPEILILDEATANIDTVTEQLLEQILRELPSTTTKVVIAHRLNTIENADEIFFINAGELTPAGSMNDALDLLLHHHRVERVGRYGPALTWKVAMRRFVVLLVIAISSLTLAAQQPDLPPPFPRTNATRLLENDRINVWDIVWPQGQPTALHRHPYDQVGTYYARGGRIIRTPDGQARTSITEIGSLSTTRKGTTHIEEGNTDPPLRAVFIELKKDGPSGSPPAAVGAASFPRDGAKQLLDDDRVIAWDYTWASAPRGLQFRAARETVIVWLGDGSLRVTTGGASTVVPVKSGTMRHIDRGSGETLEMTSGSPRALFFELK